MTSLPWLTADAACLTVHPHLFDGHPDLILRAKEVCTRCPLTARCLEHALLHDESGVWGATSDQDRKRLRRTAA